MNSPDKEQKNIQITENRAIDQVSGGGDFVFLYKKTERVAAALYMVTGLFPEEEPLRRSIRHKANRLLEVLLSLRRAGVSANSVKWSWQELAADLVSGLNLALMGGLLSEMNSSVLIRELNSLSERVAELRDDQVLGGSVLTASFFEPASSEKGGEAASSDSSTGRQTPGSSQSSSAKAGLSPASGPRSGLKDKDFSRPAADNSASSTAASASRATGENSRPNKGEKPAVQAKKSHRQHEILKVASEKGEITVKDAARAVTGCSEKTLQRELNDLVQEGVLKKEGKRRWTRYSFA